MWNYWIFGCMGFAVNIFIGLFENFVLCVCVLIRMLRLDITLCGETTV